MTPVGQCVPDVVVIPHYYNEDDKLLEQQSLFDIGPVLGVQGSFPMLQLVIQGRLMRLLGMPAFAA